MTLLINNESSQKNDSRKKSENLSICFHSRYRKLWKSNPKSTVIGREVYELNWNDAMYVYMNGAVAYKIYIEEVCRERK